MQGMADTMETQIVVAGGGLIGLTLALALDQAGIDTIVVDPIDPGTVTDAAYDGRNTALALATCRLYRALGLWTDLEPHAQSIPDIVVSYGTLRGGASPRFLHFDHAQIGDEPLGHFVENRYLRQALFAGLARAKHVRMLAPATIATAEAEPAHNLVHLSDGRIINAALVAACDGHKSPLRTAAGIRPVGWTYDQMGIVATVEHDRPHDGIAQEYFLPNGPFAILPMTGDRSSLVWTEREDLAPAFMQLDEGAFEVAVRERFGDYLGPLKVTGPRWCYRLSLQVAPRFLADRLALVGDAAHVIHPVAGQGFNLGARDAATLAETVADGIGLGLDPGDGAMLEKYERLRRTETVAMAAATDALIRLFSNDSAALRAARRFGLGAVNRIAPLRRFFMRQAGGETGNLPKLLKGENLRAQGISDRV